MIEECVPFSYIDRMESELEYETRLFHHCDRWGNMGAEYLDQRDDRKRHRNGDF